MKVGFSFSTIEDLYSAGLQALKEADKRVYKENRMILLQNVSPPGD